MEIETKICKSCHAELSLSSFHSHGSRHYKRENVSRIVYDSRCKECVNRSRRKLPDTVNGDQILCLTCMVWQHKSHYYKTTKGDITKKCKKCISEYNFSKRETTGLQTMDGDLRQCCKCGKWLNAEEYFRKRGEVTLKASGIKRSSYHSYCHKCAYDKSHEQNCKKYGITTDDYSVMLDNQAGVCALCKKENGTKDSKKRLCIDHDHKTGKVRALLCDHCNTALGKFNDDIDLINKAIEYLNYHKKK